MQGASQIRQSFSKRKRGIAQKAYQLHKITDAKVCIYSSLSVTQCMYANSCCGAGSAEYDSPFSGMGPSNLTLSRCIGLQVFLFLANEKGASWAYATPGFGATLSPAHLKMLRQMAMPEIDEAAKVQVPSFVAINHTPEQTLFHTQYHSAVLSKSRFLVHLPQCTAAVQLNRWSMFCPHDCHDPSAQLENGFGEQYRVDSVPPSVNRSPCHISLNNVMCRRVSRP